MTTTVSISPDDYNLTYNGYLNAQFTSNPSDANLNNYVVASKGSSTALGDVLLQAIGTLQTESYSIYRCNQIVSGSPKFILISSNVSNVMFYIKKTNTVYYVNGTQLSGISYNLNSDRKLIGLASGPGSRISYTADPLLWVNGQDPNQIYYCYGPNQWYPIYLNLYNFTYTYTNNSITTTLKYIYSISNQYSYCIYNLKSINIYNNIFDGYINNLSGYPSNNVYNISQYMNQSKNNANYAYTDTTLNNIVISNGDIFYARNNNNNAFYIYYFNIINDLPIFYYKSIYNDIIFLSFYETYNPIYRYQINYLNTSNLNNIMSSLANYNNSFTGVVGSVSPTNQTGSYYLNKTDKTLYYYYNSGSGSNWKIFYPSIYQYTFTATNESNKIYYIYSTIDGNNFTVLDSISLYDGNYRGYWTSSNITASNYFILDSNGDQGNQVVSELGNLKNGDVYTGDILLSKVTSDTYYYLFIVSSISPPTTTSQVLTTTNIIFFDLWSHKIIMGNRSNIGNVIITDMPTTNVINGLTGASTPGSGIGDINDYYLNLNTGILYMKYNATTWYSVYAANYYIYYNSIYYIYTISFNTKIVYDSTNNYNLQTFHGLYNKNIIMDATSDNVNIMLNMYATKKLPIKLSDTLLCSDSSNNSNIYRITSDPKIIPINNFQVNNLIYYGAEYVVGNTVNRVYLNNSSNFNSFSNTLPLALYQLTFLGYVVNLTTPTDYSGGFNNSFMLNINSENQGIYRKNMTNAWVLYYNSLFIYNYINIDNNTNYLLCLNDNSIDFSFKMVYTLQSNDYDFTCHSYITTDIVNNTFNDVYNKIDSIKGNSPVLGDALLCKSSSSTNAIYIITSINPNFITSVQPQSNNMYFCNDVSTKFLIYGGSSFANRSGKSPPPDAVFSGTISDDDPQISVPSAIYGNYYLKSDGSMWVYYSSQYRVFYPFYYNYYFTTSSTGYSSNYLIKSNVYIYDNDHNYGVINNKQVLFYDLTFDVINKTFSAYLYNITNNINDFNPNYTTITTIINNIKNENSDIAVKEAQIGDMLLFNNAQDNFSGNRHLLVATIISTNPQYMTLTSLPETYSYLFTNNVSGDTAYYINTSSSTLVNNIKNYKFIGSMGNDLPTSPDQSGNYYLRNTTGILYLYNNAWCPVYTGLYFLIYTETSINDLYYIYYTIYNKPTFVNVNMSTIYDNKYHGYSVDNIVFYDESNSDNIEYNLKNIIYAISNVNGTLSSTNNKDINTVNVGDSLFVKSSRTIYTLYLDGNTLRYNTISDSTSPVSIINTMYYSINENKIFKITDSNITNYKTSFDTSVLSFSGETGYNVPDNSFGNDDDYYLNLSTGIMYIKSTTWFSVINSLYKYSFDDYIVYTNWFNIKSIYYNEYNSSIFNGYAGNTNTTVDGSVEQVILTIFTYKKKPASINDQLFAKTGNYYYIYIIKSQSSVYQYNILDNFGNNYISFFNMTNNIIINVNNSTYNESYIQNIPFNNYITTFKGKIENTNTSSTTLPYFIDYTTNLIYYRNTPSTWNPAKMALYIFNFITVDTSYYIITDIQKFDLNPNGLLTMYDLTSNIFDRQYHGYYTTNLIDVNDIDNIFTQISNIKGNPVSVGYNYFYLSKIY